MKKLLFTLLIILLLLGGAFVATGIINNRNNKQVTTPYTLTEDFNNIELDISSADVEFVASTDSSKKVTCQESEKEYFTVEVADNTLNITSHKDKKWYEWLTWNFNKFKVTISLPAGAYNSLNIKCSTGDVYLPKEFSFNTLSIQGSTGDVKSEANVIGASSITVSTGDIYLKNLNTKSLDLIASTGDIKLENVHVSDDINVIVSTGHVNLINVTGNNLNVNGTTSKVNLTNTIIDNNIKIVTTTGDITFADSDAYSLDIEARTGDVTGNLLTSKIFDAQSSTGKVEVEQGTSGGLCKIRVKTGDIKISIKK